MSDPVLTQLIEKFAAADACWFSSTRPDGRAHLAPIWHVWYEGRAYVVTQSSTVRARNVAVNPAVSLSLPDTSDVFILEGTARVTPELEAALNPLFKAKYNWEFTEDNAYHHIIEITPTKVIAWGANGTNGGRWRFDADGTTRREDAEI